MREGFDHGPVQETGRVWRVWLTVFAGVGWGAAVNPSACWHLPRRVHALIVACAAFIGCTCVMRRSMLWCATVVVHVGGGGGDGCGGVDTLAPRLFGMLSTYYEC